MYDRFTGNRVLAERTIARALRLNEDLAEAIALVRPYGVDVTSGVELAPGRKDHEKLRAFLAAAHSA